MNLCPGKSVGAIIKNTEGKYLALYRLKQPVGLAFPAGHINENEKPEHAMIREVGEETGLIVKAYVPLLHQIFPNKPSRCSQGSYDGHEWWVYEVYKYGNSPELMEKDKHKFVRFMSFGEMRMYIENGEVDPAWFEHILPTLKLI